jgi:hypothetical protein
MAGWLILGDRQSKFTSFWGLIHHEFNVKNITIDLGR